jgi:hypothetical protein
MLCQRVTIDGRIPPFDDGDSVKQRMTAPRDPKAKYAIHRVARSRQRRSIKTSPVEPVNAVEWMTVGIGGDPAIEEVAR